MSNIRTPFSPNNEKKRVSIAHLFDAIEDGDIAVVKMFIDENRYDGDALNVMEGGLSPLLMAMMFNQKNIAILIAGIAEVDVNISYSPGLKLERLTAIARKTMKSPMLAEMIESSARDYLLKMVQRYGCVVSSERVDLLKTLPLNKLSLLKQLTEKTIKYHQLNSESFAKLFDNVNGIVEFSDVAFSGAIKVNADSFSRVDIESGVSFFTRRGIPKAAKPKGQYGCVKQGFEKTSDSTPKWAIKTLFFVPENKYSEDSLKAKLKREAKYNQILNRRVFLYSTNNKYRFVCDWQKGKTLDSLINEGLVQSCSFKNRLIWLISLLDDLLKLHRARVAHHDIHRANIIINIETNTATFIDLGEAYVVEVGNKGYREDLYKLDCKIISGIFNKELSEKDTLYHSVINSLSNAIGQNNVSKQTCSASQALNYCKKVLSSFDSLDESSLKGIANTTINRKNLIADDLYFEIRRPLVLSGK